MKKKCKNCLNWIKSEFVAERYQNQMRSCKIIAPKDRGEVLLKIEEFKHSYESCEYFKSKTMSKLIYEPKGAAGEYAKYACNLYTGCRGGCTYCYNKKGITAKVLGKNVPTLKKSVPKDYITVFENELLANIDEYRKHGIFFSFVGDPCDIEHVSNYIWLWKICAIHGVVATVLTKQTKWATDLIEYLYKYIAFMPYFNFGFTLTGHNEMEQGCATNLERIETMRGLYGNGFKTWASIEPIIDFESSLKMIELAAPYCKHFKIGLQSGKKYEFMELCDFVNKVRTIVPEEKIYWKNSITSKFK